MGEENKNTNTEVTIDLKRLFGAVLKKWWLLLVCAVAASAIAYCYTLYFVAPRYQASSMFYLSNKNISSAVSSNDITAAKDLVRSYSVILKARSTLQDIIDKAGVNCTYERAAAMIDAYSVNETEILRVVVTSTDPEEATKLAHAIEEVLPPRLEVIIEGTFIKLVDTAVTPKYPSSPNYQYSAAIGSLIGLVVAALLILLKELMDDRIHSEGEIGYCCDVPVLTAVPNMSSYEKGASNSSIRKLRFGSGRPEPTFGPKISFSAAESYKRLRTMLQFSFSDEMASHVIGVSSAMCGEGKSTTSVNLAYTLSQLGAHVILIDCDMRRPSLDSKLRLPKQPGLSNYLTNQCALDSVIQDCALSSNDGAFSVVAAGRNPPNPIELLSSNRMLRMLKELREKYDFIVLDLPPAGEVSDAIAVGKMTDGMLLTVRQNFCTRSALKDIVRQFNYVNVKILGIVLNGASDTRKKYGYGKEESKSKEEGQYAGRYAAIKNKSKV